MDCIGIGDSDWLPEGPLAVIHHEERAADVSRAIDALEAAGFDDISAAGVCSGAFLAFRSALKDARIKRLLLVNPQFWLPLSAEQLADARQGTFASTSTYLAKALSVDAWRRVVEGEVDSGALLSILREIAARGKKALMSRFSKLSDPRPRLESELSALGERGCQTLLVLGAADSAREIFAEHMAAANIASLPEGLEVEIIQGADHVFATRDARREFRRLVARVMGGDEHEPSTTGKEPMLFRNGRRDRAATTRRRERVTEPPRNPCKGQPRDRVDATNSQQEFSRPQAARKPAFRPSGGCVLYVLEPMTLLVFALGLLSWKRFFGAFATNSSCEGHVLSTTIRPRRRKRASSEGGATP
jgi:dienelactone hydrolase